MAWPDFCISCSVKAYEKEQVGVFKMASSFIQEFEQSFPNLPLDFQSFAKRLKKINLNEAREDSDRNQILLRTALIAVRAAEKELAAQRARIQDLESMTMTDESTGLLNRRGFQREIRKALSGARRKGKKGILVICDLDGFKEINDTYGHSAGDFVLSQIAGLLQGNVRGSDSVARMGGDEFAILMLDTTEERAETRAAELSKIINSFKTEWNGIPIPIKASFGIAPLDSTYSPNDLYNAADQAMYRHKRAKDKKRA